MSDRRREAGHGDSKSMGLRWAAFLAVGTAGALTFLGRGRRRSPGTPTPGPATGRGRPISRPDAVSLAHGYETQDTDVRRLIIIMVVSTGLMIAGVAAVFAMYMAFSKQDRAAVGRLTRQQSAVIVPPEPHLQADPYRDIGAALMEQRQELSSYGWFDADHTKAHIPIDRGIALVIGKPFDAFIVPLTPASAPFPTPADPKPLEGSVR